MAAQLDIAGEVVGWQGFLEPDDVVGGEHLGGAQCPLVAVRPIGIAAAGIDHQLHVRAHGVAGGADEQLVEFGVAAAKGTPTELERLEAAGDGMFQLFAQGLGFVEQERPIGFDAVAVDAAKEPGDGLVAYFSHQVPQGDVDAAEGVFDAAAPALPKGVLAELFAEAGRFVGAFAEEQWPQQLASRRDQGLAGHGAADADEALVGDDFDDGVQIVLGDKLLGPAPFDGGAGQARQTDVDNLHGAPPE
jgi:hypothetical protein